MHINGLDTGYQYVRNNPNLFIHPNMMAFPQCSCSDNDAPIIAA